jgi:hypothetical protein
MDRYTQFGLRGDADEQIRRAVRDGFKRAGLSSAQLIESLEWYRDHGQHLGGDPARLADSFSEFAASKGWQAEHQDAAVSVYGMIRDQGPDAVMSPAPSAEEDAATIARASELLRTNPDAYWRDHELQEAQLEALERQEAAPPPEPDRAAVVDQIERQIAQRDVDKFAEMLRKEPGKYWSSPELQRQLARPAPGSVQLHCVSSREPTFPALKSVIFPFEQYRMRLNRFDVRRMSALWTGNR